MKILYIVNQFPKSSETFILNEITGLKKLGHEITILSFNKSNEKITRSKTEIHDLSKRTICLSSIESTRFSRGIDKLISFFEKFVYDFSRSPSKAFKLFLVSKKHSENFWNFLSTYLKFRRFVFLDIEIIKTSFSTSEAIDSAFILSKVLRKPFFLTFRAYELYRKDYLKELKKRVRILKSASGIFTISLYNQKYLQKLFGIDSFIIHSAIDLNLFKPSKKKSKKRIIFVGRFVEKKGLIYLIKACNILSKRGVVFDCVLIGNGPGMSDCERLVRKLNLSNVFFKGSLSVDEVRKELSEASVFVLPCVIANDGNRDILPNVLKEAMAMELPVVTSDICGISELVENGVSGILVPPKNPVAIADAIIKILENPTLAKNMGLAGRKKIKKDYNITTEVKKLEKMFKNISI